MKHIFILFAAVAIVAVATVVPCVGATATWNVDGGGDWDLYSLNWDTYFFTPGDDAIFGSQSATTATISAQTSGVNCGKLQVSSNTTDYTFDGGDVALSGGEGSGSVSYCL